MLPFYEEKEKVNVKNFATFIISNFIKVQKDGLTSLSKIKSHCFVKIHSICIIFFLL